MAVHILGCSGLAGNKDQELQRIQLLEPLRHQSKYTFRKFRVV